MKGIHGVFLGAQVIAVERIFQAKPEGGGGHSVNKCKGKILLM